MQVKLVSRTMVEPDYVKELLLDASVPEEFKGVLEDAEGLIAYIARVSSTNQTNTKYAGLIKYCMTHGHWSILEMANATFEIQTSRGISPQILRHRSFSFQEFSQRYAALSEDGIEIYEVRNQDIKNRQNSIDGVSEEWKQEFAQDQRDNWERSYSLYKKWLDRGAAKECARFLLPLGCKTKLYMNGTLRSWVHYVELRADPATQKEHREIAEAIKQELCKKFPIISEAMGWTDEDNV